jgi:23S rRNA (uracil1939-C5)-methyltransferase
VVDPPRAGLDRRLTQLLANRGIRRLTYVSCDPATLARDLRILTSNSLRLVDVAIFDLFPQTHHIETVARLSAD